MVEIKIICLVMIGTLAARYLSALFFCIFKAKRYEDGLSKQIAGLTTAMIAEYILHEDLNYASRRKAKIILAKYQNIQELKELGDRL